MTLHRLNNPRAATDFVDADVRRVKALDSKTGWAVVDYGDHAKAMRLGRRVDRLEVLAYSVWHDLADRVVAKMDGDDATAAVAVYASVGSYVLEYSVEHERKVFLPENALDWFAIPPSEASDFLLDLANETATRMEQLD